MTPPFAKRSLGQNFLHNPRIAARIVECLAVAPGDTVLEIGPGRGALTRFLVEAKPLRLIALEKDRDLAPALKKAWPLTDVLLMDAMDVVWERFNAPFKCIGNLPYNIASPLMWELFSRAKGLSRAVFMVQKEVGLRLAAKPGSKTYGALSVWVQSFMRPELAFVVGPGAFSPQPKIDSAVLTFRPLPTTEIVETWALSRLLRRVFQQRRKQLRVILKDVWSEEVGALLGQFSLLPSSRPEEASPICFQHLAKLLKQRFPA